MAQRICLPLLIPAEKNVIKVRIPVATTLYQGSQLVAETLEGTSRSIYGGAAIADITKDMPAILINQGVYENIDGARVEGYVNPGAFSYKAGDVVTFIRPENDLVFHLSNDCVSGTVAKGKYLIPAVGVEQLAVADAIGTAKLAYVIEQLAPIPVGNTFVDGIIVRVVQGR